MSATSFADVVRQRLSAHPGRPLVTFYDDTTGERTELSTTSWANWVAKTAGVFVEDLMLDQGDRVRLDLPTHWLGPVFLGGIWLAGLQLTAAGEADLVVTTPDRAAGHSDVPLLVSGLGPFATRTADLPDGADDFGALWPGQPDAFIGVPGAATDPATDDLDQQGLLHWAATRGYTDSDRVLTDLNPCSPGGIELFLGTLTQSSTTGGASVVWLADVADRSELRWQDLTGAEHCTLQRRG